MPKRQSKDANGSESGKSGSPAADTAATPLPPPAPTAVTKFQKFTTREVHRSELKNADYNPRQITDEAKLRLREAMGKVGLVQPVVWNERSGNIVGGHQRIRQLDALEGSGDYRLTVSVVDVDEVRERELNILLNNPEVCGDWDLPKLQDLLDFEGLDAANAGFDQAELLRLFGEVSSNANDAANRSKLAEELKDVKDAYARLAETTALKDDTDFYCVVVFRSYDDRKAFTDAAGLQDNRYIDGRVLTGLIEDLRRPKQAEPTAAGNEVTGDGVGENPSEVVAP